MEPSDEPDQAQPTARPDAAGPSGETQAQPTTRPEVAPQGDHHQLPPQHQQQRRRRDAWQPAPNQSPPIVMDELDRDWRPTVSRPALSPVTSSLPPMSPYLFAPSTFNQSTPNLLHGPIPTFASNAWATILTATNRNMSITDIRGGGSLLSPRSNVFSTPMASPNFTPPTTFGQNMPYFLDDTDTMSKRRANIGGNSFSPRPPASLLASPSTFSRNMPNAPRGPTPTFASNAGATKITGNKRQRSFTGIGGGGSLPSTGSNLPSTPMMQSNPSPPTTFGQNMPYFLDDNIDAPSGGGGNFLPGEPMDLLSQHMSELQNEINHTFASNAGTSILTTTTTAWINNNITSFMPVSPSNLFSPSSQNRANPLHGSNPMFASNAGTSILTTTSTTWINNNMNFLPSAPSDLFSPSLQNMPNLLHDPNTMLASNAGIATLTTTTTTTMTEEATTTTSTTTMTEETTTMTEETTTTTTMTEETTAAAAAWINNIIGGSSNNNNSNLFSTPTAPSPDDNWDLDAFL